MTEDMGIAAAAATAMSSQSCSGIERFISFYIVPAICSVGIVGNIINLVVFTRQRMREIVFVYLTALAIFDLLVVLVGLPVGFVRCAERPVWQNISSSAVSIAAHSSTSMSATTEDSLMIRVVVATVSSFDDYDAAPTTMSASSSVAEDDEERRALSFVDLFSSSTTGRNFETKFASPYAAALTTQFSPVAMPAAGANNNNSSAVLTMPTSQKINLYAVIFYEFYLLLGVGNFSIFAAIFVTLAMTAERYWTIRRALKQLTLPSSSKVRATVILSTVVGLSLLLTLPRYLMYHIIAIPLTPPATQQSPLSDTMNVAIGLAPYTNNWNQSKLSNITNPSSLLKFGNGRSTITHNYVVRMKDSVAPLFVDVYITLSICIHFLEFFILLTLNTALIVILRRRRRKHKELVSGNAQNAALLAMPRRGDSSRRHRRSTNTTTTTTTTSTSLSSAALRGSGTKKVVVLQSGVGVGNTNTSSNNTGVAWHQPLQHQDSLEKTGGSSSNNSTVVVVSRGSSKSSRSTRCCGALKSIFHHSSSEPASSRKRQRRHRHNNNCYSDSNSISLANTTIGAGGHHPSISINEASTFQQTFDGDNGSIAADGDTEETNRKNNDDETTEINRTTDDYGSLPRSNGRIASINSEKNHHDANHQVLSSSQASRNSQTLSPQVYRPYARRAVYQNHHVANNNRNIMMRRQNSSPANHNHNNNRTSSGVFAAHSIKRDSVLQQQHHQMQPQSARMRGNSLCHATMGIAHTAAAAAAAVAMTTANAQSRTSSRSSLLMARQYSAQSHSDGGGNHRQSSAATNRDDVTRMLVYLIVLHLACHFLSPITAAPVAKLIFGRDYIASDTYRFQVLINNLLNLINNSMNFFVYITTSLRYRRELSSLYRGAN